MRRSLLRCLVSTPLTSGLPHSYFFSGAGPSVKIHSVATGEVVSTLTPPPPLASASGSSLPSDAVTAAIVNPHNQFQLITGSLDGHIRIWDFLDGALLQTIGISQPIFHLAAHESIPKYVFVAAARPTKKKSKGAHIRVRFPSGQSFISPSSYPCSGSRNGGGQCCCFARISHTKRRDRRFPCPNVLGDYWCGEDAVDDRIGSIS